MQKFIHQLTNWPNFEWNNDELIGLLSEARNLQGKLGIEIASLVESDRNVDGMVEMMLIPS